MPIFHCPICNIKTFSEKEEKEHAKTHQKPAQPTEPDVKKPIELQQKTATPENNKTEEKKPEERKKDVRSLDLNFIKRFLHKNVSIALINGSTISGKLTGFNNYDLMLDDKILIPKHAMLTMQEVEI